MEASKKNLIADAGALFEFSARWTREGVPVDLTGWAGTFVVTTRSDEPVTLASSAVEVDAEGNINAEIAAAALPDKGSYAYSLRLVAPEEADPRFLLVGSFTVRTASDV